MRKCFLMLAVALVAASCGSSKKFVYFQDMSEDMKYEIANRPEAVIRVDDRLGVVVNCKSPELAIPFNTQGGLLQVDVDGQYQDGPALSKGGYLVDSNGEISFPLIGKVRIEGLTLAEASSAIRAKIIEGGYINDPSVSMEFLNMKVTVLGAGTAGVYSSEGNERVTILDVIAKTGDIPYNGRVDNVMVIREVDGFRELYKMDLRSKSVFDSPGFYLQQNDIVYVEPKFKDSEPFMKTAQYMSTAMSMISTVSTILILMISLHVI